MSSTGDTRTNRPPRQSLPTKEYRNVDEFFIQDQSSDVQHIELAKRPEKGISLGKEVSTRLNLYDIVEFPKAPVYQYDVMVGSGVEKRGLISKIWGSEAVRKRTGGYWIFDGNRIAWSLDKFEAPLSMMVDLDAEEGVTPRPGRENIHRIQIRKVGVINMEALHKYVGGKTDFTNDVLLAINFLDHLLRVTPSKTLVSIKQSFFSRINEDRHNLGGGVEAYKGIYQTIRACRASRGGDGLGRLRLNVDMSNSAFWTELKMLDTMLLATKSNGFDGLKERLKPVPVRMFDVDGPKTPGPAWALLDRMRKLGVYARHRGNEHGTKLWVIDHWRRENAFEYKFLVRSRETGVQTETNMYEYMKKKYNITLQKPWLPVVQTTKKGVAFSAEVLIVAPHQKYVWKLDDKQTSEMIRFAVTPPEGRARDMEKGIKKLNWAEDPFHAKYGFKVKNEMVTTKARLLLPPTIQFGAGTAKPMYSGRWDLKNKKFLKANLHPLKSWGVNIFPDAVSGRCIDTPIVENWIREFIKMYKSLGGVVENVNPPIIVSSKDAAEGVSTLWAKIGNACKSRPQIMFFVLPDRTSFHYNRIKKSAECRFGVVSQCVQSAHLMKVNLQYIGNVCMKVNAKLGGCTSRIAGGSNTWGHFKKPSIIIGADVSHPAPNSESCSMACMTVMQDKYGVRYAAACETNGRRVEMIHSDNINRLAMPHIGKWIIELNGKVPPEHVYYFRDGVSEGQYQAVLQEEVRDLRAQLKKRLPNWVPKFIVIVASKRHHIRFMPKWNDYQAGDKNGNPLPGMVVEYDATHTNQRDVYMCSHVALKGTARPVHYHVLLDEAGLSENELYTMIYEQCYSYVRSLTPVSVHPAIYYAHLAANRSRAHENISVVKGPQSGVDMKVKIPSAITAAEKARDSGKTSSGPSNGSKAPSKTGSKGEASKKESSRNKKLLPEEVPLLLGIVEHPEPGAFQVKNTMWYV